MRKRLIELQIALMSDKKKAAALAALLAVGAVLVVRATVLSAASPARAKGDGGAAGPVGGDSRVRKADVKEAPKPPPKRIVRLPAVDAVQRNIFLPSERHFPWPSQTEAPVEVPPKSPIGNDETTLEQERARREQAARRIEQEAGRLRLRSTIVGSNSLVVIEVGSGGKSSGSVLRLGQEVEGFTLVEVRADSAVLEKSGVRVELTLPRP